MRTDMVPFTPDSHASRARRRAADVSARMLRARAACMLIRSTIASAVLHRLVSVFAAACLLVPLSAWFCIAPAQAQSIALSFDDGLDPRVQPEAAAWNARLLDTLRDARVKAILFPAAGRIDTPEGRALVRAWGEAGHTVGNHTYSHANLNTEAVTAEAFVADVARAERVLRDMPGWRPWLRFPYLKEGGDAAERDAVRAWMSAHGYRPTPPSVDTSDWYYNRRFLSLREGCADCEDPALLRAYLDHLLDRANYYDTLARELFGRSPRHVLLLHTNAINAEYLDEVIAAFRAAGWKIVPPSRAYRDRIYAREPQTVPAGESIVWALARERGLSGLRYPAEDGVYEETKFPSAEP